MASPVVANIRVDTPARPTPRFLFGAPLLVDAMGEGAPSMAPPVVPDTRWTSQAAEALNVADNLQQNGDWEQAKQFLEEALMLREKDGPCMHLLNIIDESSGTAPADWKGFHELSEF